jgi:hypothetical protein
MGRPGLTKHRKFRRLESALGSQIAARGSLETLWDSAYENGDSYLGDAGDVESAARWDGQPGVLTKALLDAGGGDGPGFVEEVPGRPGRYMVHDLWHHAPDYVRKRRAREAARREKHDPIETVVATDSTVSGQCQPNGGQRTPSLARQAGVVRPPAPAPAPAPAHVQSPSSPASEETRTGKTSKSADPRRGPTRGLIEEVHHKTFGMKCQWDASEAIALNRLLAANPSWTVDQIAQMVRNRFDSEGVTGSRPRSWLPRLDDYAGGPLDRYNKPQRAAPSAGDKLYDIAEREKAFIRERHARAANGGKVNDAL